MEQDATHGESLVATQTREVGPLFIVTGVYKREVKKRHDTYNHQHDNFSVYLKPPQRPNPHNLIFCVASKDPLNTVRQSTDKREINTSMRSTSTQGSST